MTVQELIDEINKIEDKSKDVLDLNGNPIEKIHVSGYVIITPSL